METMNAATVDLRSQGIEAFALGDLSVSGARRFQEEQFGPLGIKVLEPLEAMTSAESATRFLAAGFAATTVVRLPPGVDPAGELGEYHSFVHDGPIFTVPVAFLPGECRYLEHEIGTTQGLRRYRYWLATPGPPRDESPARSSQG